MLTHTILAIALAVPHANSISISKVVVRGAAVSVDLRCQTLSFLEVVDGLDADLDAFVSKSEVAARADAIGAYASEHYVVASGDDGERRLRTRILSVDLAPPDPGAPPPYDQWIDVRVELEDDRPIDELAIEVTLFSLTSPDHRDLAEITWEGTEPSFHGFTAAARRWVGDARGAHGPEPPSSTSLASRGFEHFLLGAEHVAFLAALVLASAGLAPLALAALVFTLAQAMAVALAAWGVIGLDTRFAEIAVALSVAYVATDELLHPSTRVRWIEASLFGFVHGLGFGALLEELALARAPEPWALLAFHTGALGAQLAFVGLLAAGLHLARRRGSEDSHLVPKGVRVSGSAVIAALGLFWFSQRAFGWFA